LGGNNETYENVLEYCQAILKNLIALFRQALINLLKFTVKEKIE